jgi:NAD(P)-dependent dehydrogenase (short-subunit alcohol dehydrogenase family)
MSARVAGKTAVVTGAGSGIGRAAAVALAREGARVMVTDIDAASGEETAAIICRAGGEALFFRADVASSADVQALMHAAAGKLGRIDILHNNAGLAVRNPVADQDEEGWERCLSVNLKGVYLCSKYAIPHMRDRGGSIIHTASVTGIVAGGPGAHAQADRDAPSGPLGHSTGYRQCRVIPGLRRGIVDYGPGSRGGRRILRGPAGRYLIT